MKRALLHRLRCGQPRNRFRSAARSGWFAAGDCNRTIRQNDLAAARRHQIKMFSAHQGFQLRDHILAGHDVAALRLKPEILELRIVDKHIGRVWSSSAVFQIVKAAVAQQRGAVGIEKDGRKRVVVVVNDQRSLGRFQNCLGQRPRRQIGIEGGHGQAGRVEEQYHHQRCGQKCAPVSPFPGCERTHAEGNGSHQQRHAKIGKGRQGEVLHVAQGELISAGMLAERLRNISRRGEVTGEKK